MGGSTVWVSLVLWNRSVYYTEVRQHSSVSLMSLIRVYWRDRLIITAILKANIRPIIGQTFRSFLTGKMIATTTAEIPKGNVTDQLKIELGRLFSAWFLSFRISVWVISFSFPLLFLIHSPNCIFTRITLQFSFTLWLSWARKTSSLKSKLYPGKVHCLR